MAVAPPPPETLKPVEHQPQAESQPPVKRFEQLKGHFTVMAGKIKQALATLPPDIVSAEIRAFADEQEHLKKVNKDTADILGADTAIAIHESLPKQSQARQNDDEVKKENDTHHTVDRVPQEVPPPETIIENFAQKEAKVKRYAADHPPSEKEGWYNENGLWARKNTHDKAIETQIKPKGIKEQIAYSLLLMKMKGKGIEHPHTVLAVIEENVRIRSQSDLKPEIIARVLTSLDETNEQLALEKLQTGIERMRDFYRFPDTVDFGEPGFVKTIQTLIDTPEETLEEVQEVLNHYSFLTNTGKAGIDPFGELATLREILQQGGFTQQQKALLDKEELYYRLSHVLPIPDDQHAVSHSLALSKALQPQSDSLDRLYPYFIDAAARGIDQPQDPYSSWQRPVVESDLMKNLEKLSQEGSLSSVSELLAHWDSQSVYAVLGEPDLTHDKLTQLLQFTRTPEKMAWAHKYSQAVRKEDQLDIADIDHLEALWEHREQIDDVLSILDAFPQAQDLTYETIIKAKNGEVTINTFLLGNSLTLLDNYLRNTRDSTIHPNQRRFVSILHQRLQSQEDNTFPSEDIPYYAYLARNREKIHNLVNGEGKPFASLVEKVLDGTVSVTKQVRDHMIENCVDPQKLPPEMAWANIEKFSDSSLPNIISALPPEFVATLPSHDQHVIRLATDYQAGWFAEYLLEKRDKIDVLFSDKTPTIALFEDALETKFYRVFSELMTDKVINSFPEDKRAYWQTVRTLPDDFKQILGTEDLYSPRFIHDGKITPDLLESVAKSGKLEEVSDFLSRHNMVYFSPEQQTYWQFFRMVSGPARQVLLEEKNRFNEFVEEGKPTIKLLERLGESDASGLSNLLTNENIATLPPDTVPFWTFLRQQPFDLQNFLLQKAKRDGFTTLYGEIQNEQYRKDVQKEFIHEIVLTPERIGTWETLSQVFLELHSIPNKEARAMAYIRIAESLRNSHLTERTEVETLPKLQGYFANLYRPDMDGLEKLAWNTLRKELPFTTDSMLMDAMRDQAVNVEAHNWENLSWVHQAVHNYVRVTTPDYIRNLRLWLETGDQQYMDTLEQLSEKYPSEAQIPDDLATKRDILQTDAVLTEVRKLEELTSLFYEVRPEKLRSAIQEALLPNDVLAEAAAVADILEKAHTDGNYFEFLQKVPQLRKKTLAGMSPHLLRPEGVLLLDSVLSDLYRKSLPIYLDRSVKPKLADGSLSQSEAAAFVEVFHGTMVSALLEGENQSIADKIRIFEHIARTKGSSAAQIHGARLELEVIKNEINAEGGRFMSIAQPEMVEMLVRMDIPQEEAVKRVYGTDLVAFRKNSYSFYLEDMAETAANVLEHMERGHHIPVADQYRAMVRESHLPADIEPNVRAYMKSKLGDLPHGDNLTQIHQALSRIASSEDAQAEKFCRILVPGFVNKETLERDVIHSTKDGEELAFYPYEIDGIDAVVITRNGEIVQNPLAFMQDRYRSQIVPAMAHTLREGD